jgi:hypothetical protein
MDYSAASNQDAARGGVVLRVTAIVAFNEKCCLNRNAADTDGLDKSEQSYSVRVLEF